MPTSSSGRLRCTKYLHFGDRLDVVEFRPGLVEAFGLYFDDPMADNCHPNVLGSSKRVAEAIRTSANLAEGSCW